MRVVSLPVQMTEAVVGFDDSSELKDQGRVGDKGFEGIPEWALRRTLPSPAI